MNKLLILAIALSLASCKKEEWNKENAKKKCLEGAKSEMYSDASTKRANAICDCIAEKMIAEFPTEDEANKYALDVVVFTNECRDGFDKAKKDSIGYAEHPELYPNYKPNASK